MVGFVDVFDIVDELFYDFGMFWIVEIEIVSGC